MNTPEQRQRWIEAIYSQDLEQDRLFELIARLGNLLDKAIVSETVETIVGIQAVETGDCLHFGDIAIRFDDGGRVKSLCRTIDGNTEPARTVIRSLSGGAAA